MSAVIFKHVQISNFLGLKSGKLELNNQGLVLIRGENDDTSANSNGSGKSSVVDAISWALYGVTARGVTGDAVVNRTAGKDCQVEVVLELDGEDIQVIRYRKSKAGKNRLMVQNLSTKVDLTQGTDKQTQELIERMIGASVSVFQASIYAGQERLPDLPAMTDKDLKQLVEQAAGITTLEKAHALAKIREGELLRIMQQCISANDSSNLALHSASERLEQAQTQRSRFELDRIHKIANTRETLFAKAEEVKSLLVANGCKSFAELDQTVNECKEILGRCRKDLAAFAVGAPAFDRAPPTPSPAPLKPQSLTDLEENQRTVERKIIEVESQVRLLNQQIDKAKRHLDALDSKVGEACSECGKTYAEHDLEDARVAQLRSIEVLTDEVRELVTKRQKALGIKATLSSRIEQRLVEWELDCKSIKRANDEAQDAYREALREHQAAVAARDSTALERAADDAHKRSQELSAVSNAISVLSSQIAMIKIQLEEIQNAPNPNVEWVEVSESERDKAWTINQEANSALEEATRRVDAIKAVVQMFGPKGIRGELLDQVTPFLNARTSAYLSELSDGQITAVWETLGETVKGEVREKFHIKVDHKLGAEGFEGLSGGEKRKVRLAAAMALQDLVATRADRPIKLWIADEIDDALDVSGLERLMSLLEQKARDVGTVLIISHNEIGDAFRNQVVIRKEDGVGIIVGIEA